MIVDIVALDDVRPRTELPDFTSLAAFARYLERPILHDLQTGVFATEDGGRLYTYRPASEEPVAAQPVAQPQAPRRKSVRLRWIGVGIVVVVVAGIAVSFTAANVVPLTNAGVATDPLVAERAHPGAVRRDEPDASGRLRSAGARPAPRRTISSSATASTKGTLSGGAGNDCIVAGASKTTLDGGAGTGDVCIDTGSDATFKNCEATYTTP